MKKTVKIISFIMAVLFILLTISSCAASKEDIIGTWKGEWVYNGDRYSGVIVIKWNGYFTHTVYKNGIINSYVTGDYEIDGRTIKLYDDSSIVHHGDAQIFKLKSGNLVSGVSVYTKTK